MRAEPTMTPLGPHPPFPPSVYLRAHGAESACARVRRVCVRVSDWGSQEGSAGSLCSAAAVLLRFSCSYPAVEAMGGKALSLSSVAVVKKLPVSPGCYMPFWSGSLSLARVRWGPDQKIPLEVKAGVTCEVESCVRVTQCCVCSRRPEMEWNVICRVRVARRGAVHLRML